MELKGIQLNIDYGTQLLSFNTTIEELHKELINGMYVRLGRLRDMSYIINAIEFKELCNSVKLNMKLKYRLHRISNKRLYKNSNNTNENILCIKLGDNTVKRVNKRASIIDWFKYEDFEYCILKVIANDIKNKYIDCICINLDIVKNNNSICRFITSDGVKELKEVCTEISLFGNSTIIGNRTMALDSRYFDNIMIIIDNQRMYMINLGDGDITVGAIFKYLNYNELCDITGVKR